MIAAHRGLHSLGRVLTLGMACCLLSCMVMPCLLQILPDIRPKRPAEEEPQLKLVDSGIELSGSSGAVPISRRRAA